MAMRFRRGDRVEVMGDRADPEEAGSFFTGVVVRVFAAPNGSPSYEVEFDELLEDDEVTKSRATHHTGRLRPPCEDDSLSKPLRQRSVGDPVDLWTQDGWWESYVTNTYDDYVDVHFPGHHPEQASENFRVYANPEDDPEDDPSERPRVRTGMDWDHKAQAWATRARRLYGASRDYRSVGRGEAARPEQQAQQAKQQQAPKPRVQQRQQAQRPAERELWSRGQQLQAVEAVGRGPNLAGLQGPLQLGEGPMVAQQPSKRESVLDEPVLLSKQPTPGSSPHGPAAVAGTGKGGEEGCAGGGKEGPGAAGGRPALKVRLKARGGPAARAGPPSATPTPTAHTAVAMAPGVAGASLKPRGRPPAAAAAAPATKSAGPRGVNVKEGARAGGLLTATGAVAAAKWSEDDSSFGEERSSEEKSSESEGHSPLPPKHARQQQAQQRQQSGQLGQPGQQKHSLKEIFGSDEADSDSDAVPMAALIEQRAQQQGGKEGAGAGYSSDTSDDVGEVPLHQRREQQRLMKRPRRQQQQQQQQQGGDAGEGVSKGRPSEVGGAKGPQGPRLTALSRHDSRASKQRPQASGKRATPSLTSSPARQQLPTAPSQQQQPSSKQGASQGRLEGQAEPASGPAPAPAGQDLAGLGSGTLGTGGSEEELGFTDHAPTEAEYGSANKSIASMLESLGGRDEDRAPTPGFSGFAFLTSPPSLGVLAALPGTLPPSVEAGTPGPDAATAAPATAVRAGEGGHVAGAAQAVRAQAKTAPPEQRAQAPAAPRVPAGAAATPQHTAATGTPGGSARPTASGQGGGSSQQRGASRWQEASSSVAPPSGLAAAAEHGQVDGAMAVKPPRTKFTDAEKDIVVRVIKQHGRDYNKLLAELPGRSLQQVKNFVANNINTRLHLEQYLGGGDRKKMDAPPVAAAAGRKDAGDAKAKASPPVAPGAAAGGEVAWKARPASPAAVAVAKPGGARTSPAPAAGIAARPSGDGAARPGGGPSEGVALKAKEGSTMWPPPAKPAQLQRKVSTAKVAAAAVAEPHPGGPLQRKALGAAKGAPTQAPVAAAAAAAGASEELPPAPSPRPAAAGGKFIIPRRVVPAAAEPAAAHHKRPPQEAVPGAQPAAIGARVGEAGPLPTCRVAPAAAVQPPPPAAEAGAGQGLLRKRPLAQSEEEENQEELLSPNKRLRSRAGVNAWERPGQQQQTEWGPARAEELLTYCLDNCGGGLTTENLEKGLRELGFTGIESVQVVTVPLDRGLSYKAGYAVVRFKTKEEARRELPRLKQLCMVTPACPIPRPLIVHPPRIAKGHSWGEGPYPGHLSLTFQTKPHFAQANSIEFDLALEWRRLERALAAAKESTCLRHTRQLAEVFAQYQQEVLKQQEELGEMASAEHGGVAGTAVAGGSDPGPLPPPGDVEGSCCLWLRDISPPISSTQEAAKHLDGIARRLEEALEKRLSQTFEQFGYPQRVVLLRDPVTGMHSGQAVLWMESAERVRKVVQNLREMVFVFNGTPRPLDASVAVPGPPRGSQSVYDCALQAVFKKDDSALTGPVRFVEVPDSCWELADLAQRVAVYLRTIMTTEQLPEMEELKAVGMERALQLSKRQAEHYILETKKLDRLKHLQMSGVMEKLAAIHNFKKFRTYKHRGTAEIRNSRQGRAKQATIVAERGGMSP